jgi:hypothetical protein
MEQLAPCDYLVIGEHEGDYWCEDSEGVQSNIYYWSKMGGPVPEQSEDSGIDLPEQSEVSVANLLNSTLIAPKNAFERMEEVFPKGQKQISGEVKMDGASVTHCGSLNLTGNTMFLTEQNTICPAHREKDEYGVKYYWPPINLGRYGGTQNYSHFFLFCSMV